MIKRVKVKLSFCPGEYRDPSCSPASAKAFAKSEAAHGEKNPLAAAKLHGQAARLHKAAAAQMLREAGKSYAKLKDREAYLEHVRMQGEHERSAQAVAKSVMGAQPGELQLRKQEADTAGKLAVQASAQASRPALQASNEQKAALHGVAAKAHDRAADLYQRAGDGKKQRAHEDRAEHHRKEQKRYGG